MSAIEVDPMIAGGLGLWHFFRHETPFAADEWKAPDVEVPSCYETLMKCAVDGYQLFTYLKLIEEKFGHEIGMIVKQYQMIALKRMQDDGFELISQLLEMIQRAHDGAIKSVELQDYSEGTIEYYMALHLLCCEFKESPYYISPDQLKAGGTCAQNPRRRFGCGISQMPIPRQRVGDWSVRSDG